MSCSRTQYSDTREARTRGPSVSSRAPHSVVNVISTSGNEVIKLFSCSTEHEISAAHKDKNGENKYFVLLQNSQMFFYIMLINIKMLTIVGILKFMNITFLLSCIEHEKKFYNLGT